MNINLLNQITVGIDVGTLVGNAIFDMGSLVINHLELHNLHFHFSSFVYYLKDHYNNSKHPY